MPIEDWHPAQSVSLITSYMLKNALFYELELQQPLSLDDHATKVSVTREWTVRIYRRLQQFLENGFFAPYFLPNRSIIPPSHPRFETMNEIACTFCKIIASILDGSVYELLFLGKIT